MEAIAKLRNARISAQKVRLVADQVRGVPVESALQLLTFSTKKAAELDEFLKKNDIPFDFWSRVGD